MSPALASDPSPFDLPGQQDATRAEPREILYPLPSILDRLDFGAMFATPQPVEAELGCGDGSFLIDYANLHPELNLIGVERLLGRARKVERKSRRLGLANVRAVRIEASYFLQWLLPRRSVNALHVYFPDPWPKKRHAQHRLVNETFPALAAEALASGGRVYLRTDDAPYHEQMRAAFAGSPCFEPMVAPAALAEIATDFEREFRSQGIPTLRLAYRSTVP